MGHYADEYEAAERANRRVSVRASDLERMREALRTIASKATQSIDTRHGGPLLREIEALARDALGQDHGIG